MLWIVQMKLMAPITELMVMMWRPTIQRSMPWPADWTESGGYAVQPASAAPPPQTKPRYMTSPPRMRSHSDAAFSRGKAMSRAPIMSGTM